MFSKRFLFSLIVVLMVSINYTNVVMLGNPGRYNFIDSYVPLTLSLYIIIATFIFLILAIINVESKSIRESLLKIIGKMLGYFAVFMGVFLLSAVSHISVYYQKITHHNLIVDVVKYSWSGIVIGIVIGIFVLLVIELAKGYYLRQLSTDEA